ncbi:BTB/POZ and MATH domain-containing protein 1-like [Phragmites australis]|uniref:BTB/POZ and MATH domain-containing protein 1-like n=1 Tax=Phragmites australis TaxID=29695 RepID=UPI002D78601F|nr:BTB/POZ and MATH domain-containing protein 1-like [Phragmites australis]
MPTFDSASAIVGGAATRHLLHVDRYSLRKELPNGQCVKFPFFTVGDCFWCIWYFPNGARSSCADYISIFIALDDRVAKPVKAQARFTLLDQAGKPVPGHSVCTDEREYSAVGDRDGCDAFIKKEFLEASEHLVADRFTISCDVSVSNTFRTENRATPPSDLQRHLGDLLVDKEGADVTFQVAGETFSAHRCVLAARSPVFKGELFDATREGTATGLFLRIDNMEAQVFKTLLHFIYTDSLPDMAGQEESMMAEHLLVAADRYDMQRLKLICEEKLSRDINENTAAKMLRLAVQRRCQMLREACIEFLKYPPALEAVMATDDGLFEHVAKSCPVLLKELWADWFEDDSIQDELVTCL